MDDAGDDWSADDIALYWRNWAVPGNEAPRTERLSARSACDPIGEYLMESIGSDREPDEDVWRTVMTLVETAPSDPALAFVGAGPIEDLAVHHGDAFVDRLATAARRDARFRYALRCAWLDSAPEHVRTALAVFRQEPVP